MARDSGRVISQTIEQGAMYPFARLMRECGVEDADRLMDVMFVWMTGQKLRQGRSGHMN